MGQEHWVKCLKKTQHLKHWTAIVSFTGNPFFKKKHKRVIGYEIDCELEKDGVRELSEGLEGNSTLAILDLSGDEKEQSP